MRHCLTCCPVTSRLLLASLLVSLLTAPAMVRQENTPQAVRQLDTPFDVLHVPDLIYATVEGKKELQLDLARPANGTGPFPAVIVLPGGGWVACDRKASLPVIHKLAEEGFVAVCINYRCAPDSPCPAAIHDAKCAVRWLRANAAQYQIDPNHIAALGYSAGGHLACILGTTTAPELEGNGGPCRVFQPCPGGREFLRNPRPGAAARRPSAWRTPVDGRSFREPGPEILRGGAGGNTY